MGTYEQFILAKSQGGADTGFEPLWMPDFLFDFQAIKTEWAIRKGRAANVADCGLGKTPCGLVWGENVVQHTNKPVLYLTPVAVGPQTIREAEKFGVDATDERMVDCPKCLRIRKTGALPISQTLDLFARP